MRMIIVASWVAVAACGHKAGDTGGGGVGSSAAPQVASVKYDPSHVPPGLVLDLSNGKQGPAAFDHTKLAPATKLGDADVQALLGRGKPFVIDPADQTTFAFRPSSQPVPRTGDTIHEAFPPPPSSMLPPPVVDAAKELRVLRHMPEGEVKLAPELSITFSQPMVAVTSQTDAAAVQPVKLTPTPKGKWRWIGTRTILFDPDPRFPNATTYKVEVPAGTKSATGGVLAKAVTFSFETPAPTVINHWPMDTEPQRLDAAEFVLFDQKIDPQAVLATLHTKIYGHNGGIGSEPLRMLDAAEIAKDKTIAGLVESAHKAEQDGRWLVFRVAKDLAPETLVHIELPPGIPSAEGPNKTKTSQDLEFHTYPPLAIVRADCSNYGGSCPPGTPLEVVFDNPIDETKLDASLFTVSPALPQMTVNGSGRSIWISGLTKARETYKLTISGTITDAFGQHLGHDDKRSYRIGDAYPTFYGPNGMVVIDPAAKKPTLDFFTTNYDQLKVKLYRVTPSDLVAYGTFINEQWKHDHPPRPPGQLVVDRLVKTSAGANDLVETSVDLSAALPGSGYGDVVAVIEPSPWKESSPPPRMISWIQATGLGVDAHVDADNLLAFVTDLATGKPAANVAVEIRPYGITGTTDDHGMATIPLGTTSMKGPNLLVARRGDDLGFVAGRNAYFDADYGDWRKRDPGTSIAWYVIDDRKMYKPGEEVTLKGWLRKIDRAKNGDIGSLAGAVTGVTYRVVDSRNNEIAKGEAPVGMLGGFDTKFTLPKTPNLGQTHVEITTVGAIGVTYLHTFQIEEFRRPEFEATAQASTTPFIVGGGGDFTVDAKYFAGGPLAGTDVNWTLYASPTTFTPPNRSDYVFGNWQPWWGYHAFDFSEGYAYGGFTPGTANTGQTSWSFSSKTDAAGEHMLHLDVKSVDPAVPMSVTASANVIDVNRQMINASTAVIVHPSSYYVGVKAKRPFVEKGQPFDLDVIGVDLDGKALIGAAIEVKAVRLEWEYKLGVYATKEVDPQTCNVTAAKDPSPCELQTKEGGTYQVVATIVDPQGRPNRTKLTFWVSGGDNPPAREVKQELVQVIPDKKTYAPGNTAELLVMSPFYPAEGVVTWRRGGIVKLERVTLTGPTKVITVPITEGMVPNIFVQVDLVGAVARSDDHGNPDPKLPKRPAYAVGTIDLPVPPKQRTLAVTVTPNAPKLAPGESAKLALEVRDAAGRPVPDAEVAVLAVDEAVLSLTGYQFPDPLDTFYAQRSTDTADYYLRSYVKLAKPIATRLAFNGEMHATDVMPLAATGAATAAPASPVSRSARFQAIDGKDSNNSFEVEGATFGCRLQPAATARCEHSDRDSIELQSARRVLAGGEDRCGWQGQRRDQGARQPHALSPRRDRGGGRQAVRQGREHVDRTLAADGAAEPAALLELRGHVPAPGGRPESDGSTDDGQGRDPRGEREHHRWRRSSGHGAGE